MKVGGGKEEIAPRGRREEVGANIAMRRRYALVSFTIGNAGAI